MTSSNPTSSRSSNCTTVSGPDTGSQCVFPFTKDGITCVSCVEWIWGGENTGKKWCSTKVDSEGVHINGHYGFCGTHCNIFEYLPDLGTHGMNTPNTCSVVLVAGSALDNLQSVKATVNSLSKDMKKTRYIMVLLVNMDNPNIKLDTFSLHIDLAMVSCQLHTPYKIGGKTFQ